MPRALLSVSDKTGLLDLAKGLRQAGFSLVSTGGTWRTLTDAGLPVTRVSDVTGFPEILDGRVKTLHPLIHGGILARDNEAHRDQLEEHAIEPFDVVVVNLYPFRESAARPGATFAEVIEQIDIGGPALLRAAAKNHERVLVVSDPNDYRSVLSAYSGGMPASLPADVTVGDAADGAGTLSSDLSNLRLELARKAFAHTAAYDAAIAAYLAGSGEVTSGEAGDGDGPVLPQRLVLELERSETLRYGENPHLRAARYRQKGSSGFWDAVVQHKGSALSYLNTFDAEAAWRLAHEFAEPACAIIKHANPCGVALAASIGVAYERAFEADPKSAFGGVVALNRPVDVALAERIMANSKADLLIAPGYDVSALELLTAKRKAMRVLEAPAPGPREMELRRISGGFLVQEPDDVAVDRSNWAVVTERAPDEEQWRDLVLAWTVCARTTSNAIALVKGGVAVGIGAGQQSRVDAAELAARKANGRALGGACASDAFYPFRDGLDAAAAAGVAAVIQPGGSVRDGEIIAAADEHGIAMVLTGRRHFRH